MRNFKNVAGALAYIMAVVIGLTLLAGSFYYLSLVIEELFGQYAVMAVLIVASVISGCCAILLVALISAASKSDLEQEILICKDDISNYKKQLENKDEHHLKEINNLEIKIKDLEGNLKLSRQNEEEIKTKYENLEKTRDIQQKQIFDEQNISRRLEADFKNAIDRYNKLVHENARITDENVTYKELIEKIKNYLDKYPEEKVPIKFDSAKYGKLSMANAG